MHATDPAILVLAILSISLVLFVTDLVRYDLPLDTWSGFRALVEGFSAEVLTAAAAAHLDPERMTWVIVGDWTVIGPDLEALGLGTIAVLGRDR